MAKIHVMITSSGKNFAATINSSLIHFDDQEVFAVTHAKRRVRTGRPLDEQLLRRCSDAVKRQIELWSLEQELPF